MAKQKSDKPKTEKVKKVKQKSEKTVLLQNSIKEALKNCIAPAVFLAVIAIAALILSLIHTKEDAVEKIEVRMKDEGVQEVCTLENSKLKLELDPETTQFSLTVKGTGKVWYSSPQNVDDDPIALPGKKDEFRSSVMVKYSTQAGLDTTLASYSYSVTDGHYMIENGDDYIKVMYSIGKVEREIIVPHVISKERMDAMLEQVEDVNSRFFCTEYYEELDLDNLPEKYKKDEILEQYPLIADGPIYVLLSTTQKNPMQKMEKIFAGVGYTEADYKLEQETYGFETSSNKPVYNISVIYRLEDEDLVVEVPFDEIQYRSNYPLVGISILPYFGAADASEEGYLFVPEGGGSLIRFNNGKTNQASYYADMYGWDMAQGRTSLIHEPRTYFNTFGMIRPDNSYMCILEDGAVYAAVRADISGKLGNYNFVNAYYNVIHRESVEVASRMTGNMYYYEQGLPSEKITQRYRFVESDSYVDMANAYRDYLAEKYPEVFAAVKTEEHAPVAVEIVGAIDKTAQILGVPVSQPLVVTTYKESQNILEELSQEGVQNVSVKLSGWSNNGMNQTLLKKVKLVSGLGGKKQLTALTSYAKDHDMKLYLNGATSYSYDSDLLDGFFASRDAACFANKHRAKLLYFDNVHFGEDNKRDAYYLLKPSLILKMMENLSSAGKKYNAYGVSFADVGYQLSADYNSKKRVTRQQALDDQLERMKKMKADGQGIMTNMGNDYTLPVTDFVTNMDLGGAGYTLLDETIPFYQIAIHGYVDYTGEPLNLTANYQEELLKSAEYGAGLQATFMNADITEIQDTYYSYYYGANFDGWKKQFVEIYKRYDEELGHVFSQKMVAHENLEGNAHVTMTQYEDGTKVYVNYSMDDFTVKAGVTVPARDYLVVR